MSFPPTRLPALQEHQHPVPLQWWVKLADSYYTIRDGQRGTGHGLRARIPRVPPKHCPDPAKGGTKQVVTADGHIPTLPRGKAGGPGTQAQRLAQHHFVCPQVTGSEPSAGGPSCHSACKGPAAGAEARAGGGWHLHPGRGTPHRAAHAPGEKQEGMGCSPGGPGGASGAQDHAGEEPALPAALSKSRVALPGSHLEVKLQAP